MKNENQSIFQKTYLTVSPAAAKYFKAVWMETTGLSERTFRHRLAHPEMDDILLFCHVCRTDLAETLKPFGDKFKNIPPFKTNLQTSFA